MTSNAKTGITVAVLCAAFSALAIFFLSDSGGTHLARPAIPLVDTNFLDKSTTRQSYADLVRTGADLSDFDCYVCHDKKTPPPLRFDTNQNIIVAMEHVGPTTFSVDDIGTNIVAGIIGRIKRHSDPVSVFLWQSLSNSTQSLLTNYKPSEQTSKQSQEVVVQALNQVIGDPCIYEPGRFNGIMLGAETKLLMQQNPTGPCLAHLNRLLLEDAYPLELPRNRQDDVVMGHGKHGRNNNCFNCHNETNLVLLQPRDGRDLTLADSSQLCGSCHGPTYRDWLAGAHGRISGYWDRGAPPSSAEEIRDLPKTARFQRKDCVNCHNPHSPPFPSRKPAPGPHPLREIAATSGSQTGQK